MNAILFGAILLILFLIIKQPLQAIPVLLIISLPFWNRQHIPPVKEPTRTNEDQNHEGPPGEDSGREEDHEGPTDEDTTPDEFTILIRP